MNIIFYYWSRMNCHIGMWQVFMSMHYVSNYLLNIHKVTLVAVLELVLWKYSIIYALLWMDREFYLEILSQSRKHEKLLTVWLDWVELNCIFSWIYFYNFFYKPEQIYKIILQGSSCFNWVYNLHIFYGALILVPRYVHVLNILTCTCRGMCAYYQAGGC